MTPEELLDASAAAAEMSPTGVVSLKERVQVAESALFAAEGEAAKARANQEHLRAKAKRVADNIDQLAQQRRLAKVSSDRKMLTTLDTVTTSLGQFLWKVKREADFLGQQGLALEDALEVCASEGRILRLRTLESELRVLTATKAWVLASAYYDLMSLHLALQPALLLDDQLTINCDSSSPAHGYSRKLNAVGLEYLDLEKILTKEREAYNDEA